MVSLVLPKRRLVRIYAVTNAAWKQKVTIKPQHWNPIKWTGSGEQNHLIGHGAILTYGPNYLPQGFKVDVEIEHSSDGRTWKKNSLIVACGGRNCRSMYVYSEDAGDKDYNDAIVVFRW
ncbi:MAG TPA: fucose-binding lectin II [Acidobacteriota bacterium]|nr:fucose-binding lectin II [Acidobacteriota bacterium]